MSTGPGSETVRVDADSSQYTVNWHAAEMVAPGEVHRITVSVGGISLGFADVQVVATGREVRNVATGEYVPLVDGRTLPIKFRIESGIFPVRLVAVAGDGQVGDMGDTLGLPVVMRVVDAGGYPLAGISVAFLASNGGASTPPTASSDSAGMVTTRWILGDDEGTQELSASFVGLGASASSTPVTYAATAEDPDLLVYYPFEPADFTGGPVGSVVDRSGNGYHGSRYGVSSTTGRVGSLAATFDGLVDSLKVPAIATDNRSSGAITFWLKLNALNRQYNIFAKNDQPFPTLPTTPAPVYCNYPGIPAAGYSLRAQYGSPGLGIPPDRWYLAVNRSDGIFYTPTGLSGFDFWHHYAFVWSPGGKAIYLDGNLVAASPATAVTATGGDLVFSPQSCPRNEMLEGAVDEIRVYRIALSGADVGELVGKGTR